MIPRIYSPPVREERDTVELAADTVRYLRTVLRLGRGDEILLFDGTGWECRGVIDRLEGRRGTARITARRHKPLEIPVRITLAQAVPKGDKMEFIIQKATELGAARVVPFLSSRTVPRRTEERAARRLERWRRIAAEAAEQCGRPDVPDIAEPLPFREALGSAGQGAVKILFWESETERSIREILQDAGNRSAKEFFLVVGPEGGLTDDEVEGLVAVGAVPVRLGPEILRTSTAGAAACLWLRGLEMRMGA